MGLELLSMIDELLVQIGWLNKNYYHKFERENIIVSRVQLSKGGRIKDLKKKECELEKCNSWCEGTASV